MSYQLRSLINKQQGFTLLEGLIGLAVLMSLLVLGGQQVQQRLEEQLCRNAAAHLRVVADAAERYVLDNYGDLVAKKEQAQWQAAQQQKKDKKTTESLESWRYQQVATHYLPNHFKRKNLYGQDYTIYVTTSEVPKPHTQLLVLTSGGSNILEGSLQQIARQLGSQGGYISKEKDSDQEFCITGSQQGWQLPVPPMTDYQPSQEQKPKSAQKPKQTYEPPGHVASLSTLYADDMLRHSNTLHRKASAGHPELNQMETDLAMQQHAINFADGAHTATLNAQGVALKHETNQVALACTAEQPKITVKNNENVLTITAEGISFETDLAEQQEKIGTSWNITDFSTTELHSLWNKIPYYEIEADEADDKITNFAHHVCAISTAEATAAVGGLFMVSSRKDDTIGNHAYLYICGPCPRETNKSARLIKKLTSSE